MQPPAIHYGDKWLELRATLAGLSQDDLMPGYFKGYVPDGYQASAHRILYVCASVPGYLPAIFGKDSHPLKGDPLSQDFVRSLGGPGQGGQDPLATVAITALCKLGLVRGEVRPLLLLAQQQLAVQTLRFETYALAPRLIVFACGGKYSAVIRETVNAARGALADFQAAGQGDEAFLFRARGDAGEPAVLVVQPPSAFPRSAQAAWLAKAAELLR